MTKSLMVIAGEQSGDMHAAQVVERVLRQMPDLDCWGIGGPEMRAVGVRTLYDISDMAVMGLSEVLRRYGFFRRVFNEMLELVILKQPDAVLLVDYPGFNLRLAEKLHERGIKVLYYVCPQVWAWHRSRIPKIARIVDRLMVIFPFEVEVFEGTGARVDFVGHPLVNELQEDIAETEDDALVWDTKTGRVALLPGSRKHEIQRILSPMLETAMRVERTNPGVSFVIAAASKAAELQIYSLLDAQPVRPRNCQVVLGKTRQILAQADAALVASGTATVETALQGCPMLIVYRMAWPTYLLARMLVRVDCIGMVNIVAGKALCPEFIQHEVKPEAMAAALQPLLSDTPERADMLAGLVHFKTELGSRNSAEEAARIVCEELD